MAGSRLQEFRGIFRGDASSCLQSSGVSGQSLEGLFPCLFIKGGVFSI